MSFKIIIAAGLGLVTSMAVARAQTPSTAPGMDYFASGRYQGALTGGNPTGTQGVVGNPNCPQPVGPGGIRPLNWSCPTGTQSVTNNLLASNPNQNQQRVVRQNPQLTPGQQAMQRPRTQQTSGWQRTQPGGFGQTPGQRYMMRSTSGRVPTANTQTQNTGGGSALNQQLGNTFAQRNNSFRAGMTRNAAEFTGQRIPTYGFPTSNWGRNYGYGGAAASSLNRGRGTGQFGQYGRR